jgi:hypothetical protein
MEQLHSNLIVIERYSIRLFRDKADLKRLNVSILLSLIGTGNPPKALLWRQAGETVAP